MAHKRWEPWTDEELAKIAELYRQGLTTVQIADEMGVMSDRLRQVVKRHGMSGFLEPRRSWTTKQETELINDFESGMDMDEMAEKWGMARRSVYCRLRSIANRRGITLKRYWVEYFRRRGVNF